MPTCKTCLFWKMQRKEGYSHAEWAIFPEDPITYAIPETLGAVRERWGYLVAYCTHPKVLFYQRPTRDGAAVYDGSQYDASLITGEDFGCRLHTPFPPEDSPCPNSPRGLP